MDIYKLNLDERVPTKQLGSYSIFRAFMFILVQELLNIPEKNNIKIYLYTINYLYTV